MKAALLLLPLLAFSAAAQRLDAPTADPFGKRNAPARAVPGGQYRAATFTNNTLQITATDGSVVQVRPWAPGVVRVVYFTSGRALMDESHISTEKVAAKRQWQLIDFAPGRALVADTSISVVQAPAETSAQLIDKPDHLWLHGGPLLGSAGVMVDKSTLQISLYPADPLPALLESELPYRTEAAPPAAAYTAAPGGVAVRFRLQPGEELYGTGSRALPLNRRGYRLELYNQAHYASQNGEPNLNLALPVVLSSRGYGLFFDNYTAGYLDLGKADPDALEYGGEGLTALSYYIVTGKNQAEILDRYTALTGRQPLPPRWALGLIQSRFGYKSDAEMLAVAARMRRNDFPLDALVLDLYWFGGTKRQGDLAWDRRHFADPTGMMSKLKAQGVQTVLISEPYVMRASANDATVRARGLVGTDAAGQPLTVASFWAGPASILDVYKPSARAWLWSYYKGLHDQGAGGWWSDLGEPENHPEAMRHAWGPTRRVHNAYGLVWASVLRDHYAQEYPQERLFNLARSGWAGSQRMSIFPWSGDINRSWSGLQAQVPGMVGAGQGGLGYMHSDAGGFCVGTVDPELYTRWLQMASLGPILRPHGEGVPPEPYWYPEPYRSAVRAATHLRYQLLPYLYSLAYENSRTGAPLVRPMDFERSYELGVRSYELGRKQGKDSQAGTPTLSSPAQLITPNSELKTQNSQYLLGPNLLVAPVLQPGQRRRNVALPAGAWIDFYTNQTYAGGRTAGVAAPLARVPLLVRAGAFVPMTAYRPSTARYQPDTLLLRYYPDPAVDQSEFTLYDDDGHSAQALARRQFETFTARGYCGAGQTDVLLSSAGDYPGRPAFRLVRLLVQRVAAPPTAIALDGEATPPDGWAFNPVTHELEVHFLMKAGTAVRLRGLRLLTTPAANADPDALTLEAPDDRRFGPGGTTLHYTRHAPSADTLHIRNALGQVVRTLPLAASPGAFTERWNGRDNQGKPVPPGVYWAEAAGQPQRLVLTE